MTVEPFSMVLMKRGFKLTRGQTHTLQVNVGLLCNQSCLHCHLEAGPHRLEVMDSRTMDEVVAFAARGRFEVVDITGGAPEMNPRLGEMLTRLSALAGRVMLRSNLTALGSSERVALMELCRDHRVVIVASFPSINAGQLESQRGKGVWEQSIDTLRRLNAIGYGKPGSGLELNLVANPAGAFLPPAQSRAEMKLRGDLQRRCGIEFNQLFCFANVPMGRFRKWLEVSGNLEGYLTKLASGFNPCTLDGLMCRSLVSVSWDGYLYDCDFNLAEGLFMEGRQIHVSEMPGAPRPGAPIAVSDYCYACTAGSGFT